MTSTVQSPLKMPEKPVMITDNGLFLISRATVQNQQILRFNAGLSRPVMVLRRQMLGFESLRARQKAHCNVLLQCAFWFYVILVSKSLPAFGEDDFVDKVENHHRHAAVQNRRTDVINKVRHQQPSYGNPYAVDGVDDAGDDAERHHIPRDLLAQIALAAEHEIALDREVDALANDHSDHIRAEVRKPAVGGIVAEDVPLEGFPKQGHIHAGPAEIHHR